MRKHRSIALVLVLLALVSIWTGCAKEKIVEVPKEVTKEVAKIPPDDPAPNGCPDCHMNKGEGKDYRLGVGVKSSVQGHPNISDDAKVTDCVTCHKAGSQRPLSTIVHKIHLNSDTFLKTHLAYCNACHVMQDDGTIKVKGLENTSGQ